jgi:hypothetical protein
VLGVVFELFVVEKQLLASRKNELGAAVNTLQSLVEKFHGRHPKEGNTLKPAVN